MLKIPQSLPFGKGFFGIYLFIYLFCSFEIVYWDIVEVFFKRKALEANANFYVFECQCPKIMVLSKALKAKLSLIPNGVAGLSTLGLNRERQRKDRCCHR